MNKIAEAYIKVLITDIEFIKTFFDSTDADIADFEKIISVLSRTDE